MTCIGLCDQKSFEDVNDIRRVDRNSFRLGYFRCRPCDFYIRTEGVRCPCCESRLARSPRNARSKRAHNAEVVRY